MKRWKKMFHINIKQKAVAVLKSDKIEFAVKKTTEKDHCTVIKASAPPIPHRLGCGYTKRMEPETHDAETVELIEKETNPQT